MSNWSMLTLIGEDRPGIVASVSNALYSANIMLGETSMIRMGGNFTIMMMVSGFGDKKALEALLSDIVSEHALCLHIDALSGGLHQHLTPNLIVHVYGADQSGIVARVTAVLAENGFNILDLESDVAGTEDKPLYIMRIAGVATTPLESLEQQMQDLRDAGMEVNISAVETLVG